MNKNIIRGLALVGAFGASAMSQAQAAGPDLTSLTSSVDMSTTITAILAVAATIAGLFVAIRGAKTVISMIRGG